MPKSSVKYLVDNQVLIQIIIRFRKNNVPSLIVILLLHFYGMLSAVIQHLRFPFSFLLMPVFLFALSELNTVIYQSSSLWILFVILHILVYPSSNAFNSLQDQDKGSIGLIKNPLPMAAELKWITILMDMLAVVFASLIHWQVGIGVAVYILFSRLYSYRNIRLKKYAILGFLTVFVFQGFWIFMLVQLTATQTISWSSVPMACCASCLIGAVYPLSQIYQHEQDEADGVCSISYLLGYKGTFIFSGTLFLIGTILFVSNHVNDLWYMSIIFTSMQFPVIVYFIYWFYKVWQNNAEANFTHTMRLNILASFCMNACFVILYFYKL